MPRTLSDLLREHTDVFTVADRKVVRALQDDYPRAGLESLPKLAARAGVSAPTVLRMLTKIGYVGYGDFQRALHEEVTERMSRSVPHLSTVPATGDCVGVTLQGIARGIEATADRLDRSELALVGELLSDVRRPVVALGGFESEICASHLVTLLSQTRPGVRYCPRGAVSSLFELMELNKKSVVVAFDFRRYQSSTLAAIKMARESRASVVLFTDQGISPAAEQSDHVFVCDGSGAGPFESRASTVAVIEALAADVTQRLGEAGTRRIETVHEVLTGTTWGAALGAELGSSN